MTAQALSPQSRGNRVAVNLAFLIDDPLSQLYYPYDRTSLQLIGLVLDRSGYLPSGQPLCTRRRNFEALEQGRWSDFGICGAEAGSFAIDVM